MKTTHVQNNTRAPFVIIASMVLALLLLTMLIGLSDKPDVSQVTMLAGDVPASSSSSPADQDDASEDDAGDLGQNEPATVATLQPIPADDVAAGADEPAPTAEALNSTQAGATASTLSTSPAPTAVPQPTPEEEQEVAVAVEPLPTSLPGAQGDSLTDTTAGAGTAALGADATVLAAPSGTLSGNFFTRADEDEGATVARNEVRLTFDESGGGSFQGVLDITYADGSQVQIDMSGAFVYAPTTPQVMGTVNGTYRRDAVDDLQDVSTDSGDLSISSFSSGSGALCTPTCFGFTFT